MGNGILRKSFSCALAVVLAFSFVPWQLSAAQAEEQSQTASAVASGAEGSTTAEATAGEQPASSGDAAATAASAEGASGATGSSAEAGADQGTSSESAAAAAASTADTASATTADAAAGDESGEEASVTSYEQFLSSLSTLESYANQYVSEHGGDANALIINYIRTGVERYTTSAWVTFCGEENTAFTSYVAEKDKANGTSASALKNIEQFTLPNGDEVDFGHLFGCLDMAYHTGNQSTADLGSWAGDITDLVWLVSTTGIDSGTVDEMAETIRTQNDKYFLRACPPGEYHSFSRTDLYGDLDSFYILNRIKSNSSLSSIFQSYFTSNLTDQIGARYFLTNRFNGDTAQNDIRSDVLDTYQGNEGIKTLEGTYLENGVNADIRTACCYAFADWLYLTAYGESQQSYLNVFSSESSTLAPGITQVEKRAMTTDDKQAVYYLATADVSRSDVSVVAGYKDADASSWGMQRVSEQMKAVESKHGDATDAENYIPNYRAIAGINADFYNMSNGAPAGALVMNGTEYHGVGSENFFAIRKDGSAFIGEKSEWDACKDQIAEAVGAANLVVKDGKIVASSSTDTSSRTSRTAVGVTYDGQVVFMVLDGRQEPFSAGASPIEVAQVMYDAGCVDAAILDGGGSSTFVSKAEGADEAAVVNRPSDGYERSVSSSLIMVSTARPSTEFDHALISSDYDYLSVGTSLDLTVSGVSATGTSVDVPEGATLRVSGEGNGTISGTTFTATGLGDVTVELVAADGSTVLGSRVLHVVQPTALKFTKDNLNAVYEQATDLPLEATYNGNLVKINSGDVTFGYLKRTLKSIGTAEGSEVNTTVTELVYDYPEAGTIDGFSFTATPDSGLRTLTVGAVLTSQLEVFSNIISAEYQRAYQEAIKNGSTADIAATTAQTSAINAALETAARLDIYLYSSDEANFDFNAADGVDSTGVLAWKRTVKNATYNPDEVYYILDSSDVPAAAEYTLAVDMSKVSVPEKLSPLLFMLPGGDQKGRTAWDFMLQLAERISPLTTVTATITIPDGFTVDTSQLRLANDFFKLDSATVDGNTLTLKLSFITQTESVNPATANPVCVLSGLKLTENDSAAWSDEGTLPLEFKASVSYDIYAHFHMLKNLASQTEYQERYGLYPYDNSANLEGDYGAHFSDEVAELTDSFSFLKNLKRGWVRENGAWSYYDEQGRPLTGMQELPSFSAGEEDSFWYDLGENGSCTDKYSGLFIKDGKTYCARFGLLVSGWQAVKDDGEDSHDYYFDTATHAALTGTVEMNGLVYTFNDKGQLVRGAFHPDADGSGGIQYNWAGRDLWRQFVTLEEGTYWIDEDQHVAYGNAHTVTTNVKDVTWYHFDETTGLMTGIASGIFTYRGELYYADENGKVVYGAVATPGGIVFSGTLGKLGVSTGVYIDETTTQVGCSLALGWYYAGDDGYLVKDGFATIDGNTYHYSDYAITKGFAKIDGSYYLFNASTGVMRANGSYWVGDNEYGIPGGTYKFRADGRMVLSGWMTQGLNTYYYVDDVPAKGLTKIGDSWYLFNRSSGVMYHDGSYWVNDNENGSGFEGGFYQFGSDGKMVPKDGWVIEGSRTYYYLNGVPAKGLTKIGSDWYLFNRSNGAMYHDGSYWVFDNENGSGFTGGSYQFGSDGKMALRDGWVTEGSQVYYYVNGAPAKGLTKIGDSWYLFNRSSGKMCANAAYWVFDNENGSGFVGGTYQFGADGKMALKDGWVTEGSQTFYYVAGEKAKGLTKVGDAYYFFNKSSGVLYRDTTLWVAGDNSYGFAGGMYYFDAEGKMVSAA